MPKRELLAEVEAATPAEPSARDWFTAAQDAWICLDSALRVARDENAAADASWFLLEPIFQFLSESLFGFSNMGSRAEVECEPVALADPKLVGALSAVNRVIDLLENSKVNETLLDRLFDVLRPIKP